MATVSLAATDGMPHVDNELCAADAAPHEPLRPGTIRPMINGRSVSRP